MALVKVVRRWGGVALGGLLLVATAHAAPGDPTSSGGPSSGGSAPGGAGGVVSVPEPSTLLLMVAGVAGIAYVARSKKRKP